MIEWVVVAVDDMGRSDVGRTDRPYVGSRTEHLLEFTEIPVVVVPEQGPRS